jgi:hypothetical protein
MIADDNHFRYFAPDPPATFPEGFEGAPLEFKTTTEMMAEREAKRATRLDDAIAAYNNVWENSGTIDAYNVVEIRRNAIEAALKAAQL